ncbi:MAG TPA: hypothetical protein VF543_13510 [Pyrinomonadaceae bacterium]
MINFWRLEGISILSAKTMKRYFQILGLIVLALAAGGWGSVMAAVLCPHANSNAFKPVKADSVAVEEACHPVKPEPEAKPHCHDSGTSQEAAAASEIERPEPAALPASKGDVLALRLPQNVPCTHCLSRPEAPSSTVVAQQRTEQRRGFEAAPLQAATPFIPAQSFIKPVLYRQGAPPGSCKPKHLLLGILLI